MSKNNAIIIQFVLPLTPFYRSGARRSDVYKRDAFVTSWRFHNRAWQPERHDHLSETSRTLWIHRGALTNQRCSLATGCGITWQISMADCIDFPIRNVCAMLKQTSKECIIAYFPQIVSLSIPEIPTSGTQVLIQFLSVSEMSCKVG